ncbi:Flp family type IVb pilin [Photobacterium nomapromontoriensis]|uniref:Flp family type IVb pilin n=1 Tax=Photobacterium nomapromontoriensis TaxID=2910237 RepID=UPI003D0FE848
MLRLVYSKVDAFISTYKKDERGVTAIEYGLIGVAMAVMIGAAVSGSGNFVEQLKLAFDAITTAITTATP